MRKFIAFGFLILAIALLFGQGLHKIPKNTKIEGWLSVRGDIYPPWNEIYDIGKSIYWYDSMWLAYPQFRNILVWSADSTDSASISPTKLEIDSVITLYWSTPVAIADTTYTNWITVKDSSKITVTSRTHWVKQQDSLVVINNAGGGAGRMALQVISDTIAIEVYANDDFAISACCGDDYAIQGSATDKFGVYGFASSYGIYGNASNYGIKGDASLKAGGAFQSKNKALVACLKRLSGIQDSIATFGIGDSVETMTTRSYIDSLGGYNIVGGSYLNDDLYVKDSTFLNTVIDSGNHVVLGDLTVSGETNLGNAVTDTVTCTGYLTLPNDTILGDVVVKGDVKPEVVSYQIIPLYSGQLNWTSGTQNAIATNRPYNIGSPSFFDSLVVDSVFVLLNCAEDSNKLDSINIRVGSARTLLNSGILAEGTDWGADGLSDTTYEISGVTIPANSVLWLTFKPKAESAANKVAVYSIIMYGHPQ